ncbi:MAG: phosphate signaling complex protein PhoU [Pseudomonadota bacterium]
MMNEHTVTAYDDELKLLFRKVSEMGGLAERITQQSVQALSNGDVSLAQAVIVEDAVLDRLQNEVDENAILTIAKRQPMAMDLREIVAAIRISGDLERVGDLGKNIAKRVIAVSDLFQPKSLMRGLEHLAELGTLQLKDVLDAYSSRDAERAQMVWHRDEEVDQLHTAMFRELLTYMMEDPRNITLCTHLLFCAKNIERIGDHATNIAETIHYVVTGEMFGENRPKGDRASEIALELDGEQAG